MTATVSGKPLTIRFGLEFKGEIVKIQLYQDGNIGLASYKLCTTTQSMRGSASRVVVQKQVRLMSLKYEPSKGVLSCAELHGRDVYWNLQGSNGMVIYKEVPPPAGTELHLDVGWPRPTPNIKELLTIVLN
ncbi:hypothetical protein Tco_0973317 [Tanacetum coccineum]